MGYLSVRVTFHQNPLVGIQVRFHESGGTATTEGAVLGEVCTTDADGIASLPFMVPAKLYVCRVQGQPPTAVHTVVDPRRPFPLITPVGRPYLEFDSTPEYDLHASVDPDDLTEDEPSTHGLES
jgi:hypothetical protein